MSCKFCTVFDNGVDVDTFPLLLRIYIIHVLVLFNHTFCVLLLFLFFCFSFLFS